ncbi:MAG: glycine dehydrogenase, partial [Gaiellales bacterium]|nr:glycine dehydrogenase [Gaiellales bacterium]
MLRTLGYASLAELAEAAVPPEIRMASDLDLPPAQTEIDVLAELREIGQRNRVMRSMIGLGYYATHTPQVVLRKVLENPAWYTAYTPYQPEISQGRLEALLNFQTMVADLSGLPAANASLLDEATAAAEAMGICLRASTLDDPSFVIDSDCLPQTIAVVRTRAEPLGVRVIVHDLDDDLPDGPIAGLLLQYPGASGALRDHEAVIAAVHERGGLVAVASDPLAAVLCRPPGEIGADIVVGSSQRFGVPPAYGGPHAAFICVRSGLERQLPGRLVGVSVDADGAPALRLALQTREQHIRREKATSNICTAQVLLAVMASMYAVYHGREGLEAIARRVHRFTSILAEGLRRGGLELRHDAFFDTIQVRVPHHADAVVAAARQSGINLRRVDSGTV